MKRLLSALCILTVAAALNAGTVWADDEPSVAMPGKILIVKAGKLAKFIAKPVTPAVFALPGPTNDPTVEGAVLRFQEVPAGAGLSFALPAQAAPLGWKGLGATPGSKGYKYKGAGTPSDPCKVVLLKPKIIKGICKGTVIDMDQPVDGDVAVALKVGTGSKSYCAEFGGAELKNDATLLKRKDAPAVACTCGTPGTFTFRNNPPTAATCGTITDAAGASTNLDCNGLYIGSGSGSLTLPEEVPDSEKALVMDVACCTGDALVLAPTTSTETGDIETCTSAGCKFGAPLPLPNTGNPATSTCVFNTYAQDVVGEATCSDGNARLVAPLISRTFLTGDILPRRCSGGTNPGALCSPLGVSPQCTGGGTCVADSDLQPCPICNPTTGKCNGGFNGMDDGNQLTCVPDGGLNIALPQFPTSHTCTISTLVLVGDLPVPFLLSTGTQSDTALPNTANTQQRVFCGHCRDVDLPGGTGRFGLCTAGTNAGQSCAVTSDCGAGGVCEAQPCESDAECAGDPASREVCVQRNEGAFGPGGGGNMTITEIGTPAGDLTDFAGHQGTMVSTFCIPPSFNAIIDGAADLPGPGAVSLPGVFDVNSPSGAFVDGSELF